MMSFLIKRSMMMLGSLHETELHYRKTKGWGTKVNQCHAPDIAEYMKDAIGDQLLIKVRIGSESRSEALEKAQLSHIKLAGVNSRASVSVLMQYCPIKTGTLFVN